MQFTIDHNLYLYPETKHSAILIRVLAGKKGSCQIYEPAWKALFALLKKMKPDLNARRLISGEDGEPFNTQEISGLLPKANRLIKQTSKSDLYAIPLELTSDGVCNGEHSPEAFLRDIFFDLTPLMEFCEAESEVTLQSFFYHWSAGVIRFRRYDDKEWAV